MIASPTNPTANAPRTFRPMPVAGQLLSLIGWLANAALAARAAMWGPIALMVLTMDASGQMFERLFSFSTFTRLTGPLLIGSCFVFVGNRLAGRKSRRCVIEAIAALIGPPVLSFAAAIFLIHFSG